MSEIRKVITYIYFGADISASLEKLRGGISKVINSKKYGGDPQKVSNLESGSK